MDVAPSISATEYPKQDGWCGRRVKVCFGFDTSKICLGVLVRLDTEPPFEGIISLDDGRYLRITECQWSPVDIDPARDPRNIDMAKALEWYTEKAEALQRYMAEDDKKVHAIEAVAVELSLDAGRRGRIALAGGE